MIDDERGDRRQYGSHWVLGCIGSFMGMPQLEYGCAADLQANLAVTTFDFSYLGLIVIPRDGPGFSARALLIIDRHVSKLAL